VNYPCNYCKEWFAIDKTSLCAVCGFYVCINCGTCSQSCQKEKWQTEITKILAPEINYSTHPNLQEKINKLLKFIEDIKISKEKRECQKGVPISYAKNRIKSCIVKMNGYRTKSQMDVQKFNERHEEVLNKNIGDILTINQAREEGSYGQEYRDVFNYCLCLGKLKKVKTRKIIDDEEIEIEVYKRVEDGQCPMLDLKELIVKFCPKCGKKYDESENYCSDCFYQKGKKQGQPFQLRLKISNKDICQLNRGDFEKHGQSKST